MKTVPHALLAIIFGCFLLGLLVLLVRKINMVSTPNSIPLDLAVKLARLKIIFGFLLLGSLIALAAVIALSKVTEAESYGLMPIVTALATLAGGFSNWAFGQHSVQIAEPSKEEQQREEVST